MPAVNIRSLADFKRILALPGATIQLVRHDYLDGRIPAADPFWQPRTIRKVRSGDVEINMPGSARASYLEFGKAANWVFAGNSATLRHDTVTMVYVISLPD